MNSLLRKTSGTIVALLLTISIPALAGPPFFTDDPEPVRPGHWELYLASQRLKAKDGSSGTAPHAEINYGAAKELQLHLVAPLSYSRPEGGALAYGPGDTELGAKYRFLRETPGRPQAGIFPLVELPTGNAGRGLGGGKPQVFLPLWLQKSWGAWTSYAGGGCWINPGSGKKNWTYAGWLLQRDLSASLTLGGELFHRTPDAAGGKSGTGFTAGGQFNFTAERHLLFSAGRDLSGPDRLTAYLAFQLTR
jgi:hypothetical protein